MDIKKTIILLIFLPIVMSACDSQGKLDATIGVQNTQIAALHSTVTIDAASTITANPTGTQSVSETLTPTATVTATPSPTHTPVSSPSEYEIVQIGWFESIYLRYDPEEWESFNEYQEEQLINAAGDPIESLRHWAIPGCIIHGNLGYGPPITWQRQDTNLMIGDLEYRVESWTDSNTRQHVLIVYQYPYGKSGYGIRIELMINQEPQQCIANAQEVLVHSEDLILAGRPAAPAEGESETGPGSTWRVPLDSFIELEGCSINAASHADCVASVMEKFGAPPEAIDFTTSFGSMFILESFMEKGRVDLGFIFYPTRANNNWQYVLLNGLPRLVSAEEAGDVDITEHSQYPSLAEKQPNLVFWTSENIFEVVQSLPEGGQRFVFSYPLYKGCHACDVGGYALVGFDFDPQGQFLGKTLLALGVSKPAVQNP